MELHSKQQSVCPTQSPDLKPTEMVICSNYCSAPPGITVVNILCWSESFTDWPVFVLLCVGVYRELCLQVIRHKHECEVQGAKQHLEVTLISTHRTHSYSEVKSYAVESDGLKLTYVWKRSAE